MITSDTKINLKVCVDILGKHHTLHIYKTRTLLVTLSLLGRAFRDIAVLGDRTCKIPGVCPQGGPFLVDTIPSEVLLPAASETLGV